MAAARELKPAGRTWSIANPGNRAAREELLGAILELAEQQLRGGGRLLDCGCGTGWLLAALAGAGVAADRLYGVDTDPDRVAAASRRLPGATVERTDGRDLPFPDGTFDAVFQIVSLSSMGGAASVRAALAESGRVLVPTGIVVVYEPRFPNPLNRRTRLLRRADLEAAGLSLAAARSVTLLPSLGRRLGRLTPTLHPLLSAVPPLRSHRLLILRPGDRWRAGADGRPPRARTRAPLRGR